MGPTKIKRQLVLGSFSSDPTGFEGAIYFNTTENRIKIYTNGVWGNVTSDSSEINYITNGKAEIDTAGYATYADAAGASPVDGTDGSANITWTRTTSSPLRGTASFLFTKDAVNRRGEGSSYDFTIDSADTGAELDITMDYTVASGTYISGDIALFVYDVTNATFIPILVQNQDDSSLPATATGVSRPLTWRFTASDSTSYRLIWHTASTSALAYSLKFDNIRVGPKSFFNAPIVGPWESFTPTGSWTTNTSYTGKWRRVGDSMEIQIGLSLSGAPNAAILDVYGPSGYTVDTDKISSIVISARGVDSGVREYVLGGYYTGGFTFRVLQAETASGSGNVSDTVPFLWGASDNISVNVTIPISGWDSGAVMSTTQANDQTILITAGNSSGQTIATATETAVTNWTEEEDTHNSFNPTTGVFTAPSSGKYEVIFTSAFDANATGNRRALIVKNGSTPLAFEDVPGDIDAVGGAQAIWAGSLNANETLEFKVRHDSGGNLDINTDARRTRIIIKGLPNFTTFGTYSKREKVESHSTGVVAWPFSAGITGNVTSILVPPGTWDLSAYLGVRNSAALGGFPDVSFAISTVSATFGSQTDGHNQCFLNPVADAFFAFSGTIPSYEVTVNEPTTYYLIAISVVTTNFQLRGYKLKARRV